MPSPHHGRRARYRLTSPLDVVTWDEAWWAEDPGWTSRPADGGDVQNWEGVSATLTQATAADRPTYQASYEWFRGRSAVVFDGVDHWLEAGTWTAMAQPNSIVCFANLRDSANNFEGHMLYDGWDSTNRHMIQTVYGNQNIFAYAGAGITATSRTDPAPNLYRVYYNTTGSGWWINGVSQGSGNIGTHDLTGIHLGVRYDESLYHWEGGVAFLGIKSGNLTTPQVQALEGIFAHYQPDRPELWQTFVDINNTAHSSWTTASYTPTGSTDYIVIYGCDTTTNTPTCTLSHSDFTGGFTAIADSQSSNDSHVFAWYGQSDASPSGAGFVLTPSVTVQGGVCLVIQVTNAGSPIVNTSNTSNDSGSGTSSTGLSLSSIGPRDGVIVCSARAVSYEEPNTPASYAILANDHVDDVGLDVFWSPSDWDLTPTISWASSAHHGEIAFEVNGA